jgi:Fe-S-cluster containining protein
VSESIRGLRLSTNCHACTNKCCSQPYDWVYLTEAELTAIERRTGLLPKAFSSVHVNRHAGFAFRVLNLPCRFLDTPTGNCTIYESRPLVCKVFPFYPEPLTGHATLLPAQCGENLVFHPNESMAGWTLQDFDTEIIQWLSSLWSEAAKRNRISDQDCD